MERRDVVREKRGDSEESRMKVGDAKSGENRGRKERVERERKQGVEGGEEA